MNFTRRIDVHDPHSCFYSMRRGSPKRDAKFLSHPLMHLIPIHGRILLLVHEFAKLALIADGYPGDDGRL